ncbi:MAG: phytoene desaturase family protein [Actinomycetes bacterium]
MSNVVVIGAGIGGMCAATRLAKAGHSVHLYEASDEVGGKCRTEWVGKYAFDTGPSLLTLPAVYKDFFLKTGKPLEEVLSLQAVNPSFDYRFADGSNVEFVNLSRYDTLEAIEKSFGSQAKDEWRSIMRRAEKMWDVSREPFIESELASPLSLLKRASLLKDLLTIAPWKSLRTLVKEYTTDVRLQCIIDRYATYSGSDPRRAPAVLASIAYVEEAFGAWHISGGIGQLARAVHQRAIECGVTFHLDSPVAKISHTAKSVTGIVLSTGETILADVVVANADASYVYTTLISERLRILRKPRKALAQAEPSLAGFSLLLGLKPSSEAQPLAHHTVLFPVNYDDEFDAIFTQKKPVDDPTIYICAPKDAAMMPTQGHESWSVLVNAPPHSESGTGWNWNDANFAHEYANKIISLIESRGISIRDRLEVLEIRTPADLEAQVRAPGGSIYGTSSNGARSAFLRARNRSPLKGLYCVGGSAHPGGGLPLVGISAEIVANAIAGKRT